MLINHFIKLFCIIKIQLNFFLFFFFTLISEIYTEDDPLTGPFFNSLLLQNGKLFIANYNGMHIYDKELQTKYNSHPYSNVEIDSQNLPKALIVEFPFENGMIICLVKNTIFFWGSEGEYLFSDTLPNYDYTYAHINLLTYKKVDDYYHYIVTFIKDSSLYILYYKADNTNNVLVHDEIFKPFYFDFPNIIIKEFSLGCQIMDSANKGKVLTCCFQTDNAKFIVIQSFIIENDFQEIEEDLYAKVESPDARIIHSTISEEGKNLVGFYRDNNGAGYYFIYNLDNNTIIKNEPLIKTCLDSYNKFKLFYFKESREYVFTCSDRDKGFTIMRMDSNFNIINSDEFSDINYNAQTTFNTFSIIYNTIDNKYAFIMDQTVGEGNSYMTGKYDITTDFTSPHSGGTPPGPYSETPPSTSETELPSNHKYYVNTRDFEKAITVNDQNGVIINFLSKKNPIILDKNNEPIRKEIYAMNIEELPSSGQLKYIINGELKDVELNKRIFGEFKFLYIPEQYGLKTKILYRIYLKNYSKASTPTFYWLYICKVNCSCTTETGSCNSCADGYGFYRTAGNPICVNGTDFCSQRYYTDKSSYFLKCVNETECPADYPFYNEYTRECRYNNFTNDNDEEDEMPPLTEATTQESQIDNAEESSSEETGPESESESSSESSPDNEESEAESSSESSAEESETSNESEESETSESSPDNPEESETETERTNDSSPSPDNTEESSSKNEESESNDSNGNSEESSDTNEESTSTDNAPKSEIESETSKKNNYNFIDLSSIKGIIGDIKEEILKEIIDFILGNLGNKNITNLANSELINYPNKTHQILSNLINSGNINMSSGSEDIILKTEKIIYQITNTQNQKNSEEKSDISIIDLGECEKIIKKNISSEDDTTPLIILKIDTKNEGSKSTSVQYEVYNPYTNEKIDLNICQNAIIKISAPVNLTGDEVELYEDLKSQGYDLYDATGTFYQEICTQFTSKNGTDVILSDRRNYYYDQNATFCEESCTYKGINTENQKVMCYCYGQNEENIEEIIFDKEKFFENFYKVQDYTNYQVLFCYKLIFSSKGLIKNIIFYIFIILVLLFLISMVLNLLKALKKIDEIIFKIFQDKFMFEIMQNIIRTKRNEKKEKINNDNKDQEPKSSLETTKKLTIFQKLRLKYKKSSVPPIEPNNINNNNNKVDDNNNINNNKIDSNINNENNNNINNIGKNIIKDINIYNNLTNNRYNDNITNTCHFTNNKNKENILKVKNSKLNNINDKKNVNFRMNFKIDYSNSIRDKNFNLSNILDDVIKKDNKISSSINLKNKEKENKEDFGNGLDNMDNSISTKNIINFNNVYNINNVNNINNTTKSFKKYYKRNTAKNIQIQNNNDFDKINLRNSCNLLSLKKFKLKNNNNTNSNSNPPLRKNIVAYRRKNAQYQNVSQDSSSSDKKIIFKKPLNAEKRKSKTKIYRKSCEVSDLKAIKLINYNNQLVNFKNEDMSSKNQIYPKNMPLIEERIQEKQNKVREKPKEENLTKNNSNLNSKYIDAELNKMDYETALIYDKREYWQYYISLLKQKHLIILVFISNDDYNVFLLKLSLFILSIALFFALNTLFFRDSTMRYIFTNQGRYNFLYKIPKVLYSTLISSVMTYILKILSLSQNDLIKIKKESDRSKAKKMAADSKKCLTIKLYIFFIIGVCLIIFCWYYTTAFAAVYPNIQMHLIKDILISFGISMIYPFVINIMPGLFRIPSLKAKNKDQKCLYTTSKILAFL